MACSDGQLVDQARAGDRAALDQLTARHRERIRRFVGAMTGDDHAADDLTQEAQRLAIERLPQLAEPERFGSWILAIAVNRCRSHLQRQVQRQAAGEDNLATEPQPGRRSVLSSIVRRESVELLALAIDRLPILLREAFVLFHVEQLPYAEIAALTGANEGTLQVRVHRAKALLRQQLGTVVDTWWQSRG